MFSLLLLLLYISILPQISCDTINNKQDYIIYNNKEIKSIFINNININSNNRYLVLLIYSHGFANRIRSIADWYVIAKLSNRILLISWSPTADCYINFEDLYENYPKDMIITSNYVTDIKLIEQMSIHSKLTYQSMNSNEFFGASYNNNKHKSFILSNQQVLSNINVFITVYNGLLTLESINCQLYMSMRSNFYSSLIPVKSARDYVKNIYKEHFNNYIMIGIHIRTHKDSHDWEVVTPAFHNSKFNRSRALKFGEGASINDFINIMNNIDSSLSHINYNNEIIKKHKFYIASNDFNIKESLLKQFDNSIVIDGNYERDSFDGIYFAFIEWLIISNSDLIVHTYGSSFAVEAGQVYNKAPIVGVWGGALIHYNDKRLPYCGNNQYLRAFTSTSSSSIFYEGTHDNREVVSINIDMHYCNHLNHWGLKEVICSSKND